MKPPCWTAAAGFPLPNPPPDLSSQVPHAHHEEDPLLPLFKGLQWAQTNAVPLLTGLLLALICANSIGTDYEYYFTSDACPPEHNVTYQANTACKDVSGSSTCHLPRWLLLDCPLFGHNVTLHFVANDLIMALFFGLAMKEVTEALLPGGSLNPPSKAANPILTCMGGVFGPIAVYFILLEVRATGGVHVCVCMCVL